mgnify:CR=1 FL=1
MKQSFKPKIILGPPGTGKTETCIKTVEKFLRNGVPPDRIGYFAFTRRANIEARERAMETFGLSAEDLPYFRTLHSLSYSQLMINHSQIMSKKHFEEVSEWLKVGRFFLQDADPNQMKDIGYGDKYLELINMARITQQPLKKIYSESKVKNIVDWKLVDYVSRGLQHFKNTRHLYDYTDMLVEFVARDAAPRLDVVIIDEAQDLSTIQWKMVSLLAAKAQHVIIAGDDDQAIYRWAGADVKAFIDLQGDVTVLDQSYRIPLAHHTISQKLIHTIKERKIKEFKPKNEDGSMAWHRHSEEVNMNNGQWLLLARTRKGANQLEEEVRQRGMLYSYEGSRSTDSAVLSAVVNWERLRNGDNITSRDVRLIYKYLRINQDVTYGYKTLPEAEDSYFWDIDELMRDGGLLTKTPWDNALSLIPEADKRYIARCLKNGESIIDKPRITISTIHRSKGAQADNVLLLTDNTGIPNSRWRQSANEWEDETRVFYVGLTRAKKNLHLIHPMFSEGFELPS